MRCPLSFCLQFVCHAYENDGKTRKSRVFTKDSDISVEPRHSRAFGDFSQNAVEAFSLQAERFFVIMTIIVYKGSGKREEVAQ